MTIGTRQISGGSVDDLAEGLCPLLYPLDSNGQQLLTHMSAVASGRNGHVGCSIKSASRADRCQTRPLNRAMNVPRVQMTRGELRHASSERRLEATTLPVGHPHMRPPADGTLCLVEVRSQR